MKIEEIGRIKDAVRRVLQEDAGQPSFASFEVDDAELAERAINKARLSLDKEFEGTTRIEALSHARGVIRKAKGKKR